MTIRHVDASRGTLLTIRVFIVSYAYLFIYFPPHQQLGRKGVALSGFLFLFPVKHTTSRIVHVDSSFLGLAANPQNAITIII